MTRVVKRSRTRRKPRTMHADFRLAPAVMALRMPTIIAEARDTKSLRTETGRAGSEKMAAAAEGMVAAQMSMAQSASQFWFELMTGRPPALLSVVAAQRAMNAALKPAGGKVRKNYRRLSRPKP